MGQTARKQRETVPKLGGQINHLTLRAIFDQSSDGIAIIDDAQVIVAMNPALEQLIGHQAADIVGRTTCRTILACKDESGCSLCDRPCPGELALSTAVTTPYEELFLQTQDGRSVPVSASFTPLQLGTNGRLVFLMVIRDITNKHRQEQHLRHLALTDPLTGLYNRRSLTSQLRKEITRSRRYHHPLSLLFIDLDNFKRYNDERGHQQGDAALVALARLLRKEVRATDTVARYGGEEFIILLSETDRTHAYALAEHLRKSVEAQLATPTSEAGGAGGLTISIGLATFPSDAYDGLALLEEADRVLYTAKASGRNRVATSEPAAVDDPQMTANSRQPRSRYANRSSSEGG